MALAGQYRRRAVRASAFGWHGVDAGNGLGQDAIQAALMVSAFFPRGGIANLRRAEQTAAMASIAVLGDDLIWGLGTPAPRCNSHFHAFAFLALDAHLANRLQAFGNVVIGRSGCAHCPEGEYGCWYGQHLLDLVHANTLMVANHARGHGTASVEKYSGNPEAVKRPYTGKGYCRINALRWIKSLKASPH